VSGGTSISGYLPIVLKLAGRKCVVVGGGEVATRRVQTLLEAGAAVTVVAPELSNALETLVRERVLTHLHKEYDRADVEGAFLVIAATDQTAINARVAADASAGGILYCDAEAAERSDFLIPSLVRRGDLLLAVTTLGSSPSLAARIRQELELAYGPEFGALTALLKEIRETALHSISDAARRRAALNQLASDSSLLSLLREGRAGEARSKAMACISSLSD
jgi:precorrin-2 dehydrogenase / sirohydrochlorin ferrochelatase